LYKNTIATKSKVFPLGGTDFIIEIMPYNVLSKLVLLIHVMEIEQSFTLAISY